MASGFGILIWSHFSDPCFMDTGSTSPFSLCCLEDREQGAQLQKQLSGCVK